MPQIGEAEAKRLGDIPAASAGVRGAAETGVASTRLLVAANGSSREAHRTLDLTGRQLAMRRSRTRSRRLSDTGARWLRSQEGVPCARAARRGRGVHACADVADESRHVHVLARPATRPHATRRAVV